jgi:hypothetical protein
MKKQIEPEGFIFFNDYAELVGYNEASYQLQRVIEEFKNNYINLRADLRGSFHWAESPQGHHYWEDINKRINNGKVFERLRF